MAEVPVQSSSDYWCYNCNKRVCVETQGSSDNVVCQECKDGFVETLLWSPPSSSLVGTPDHFSADESSTSVIGSQFLQLLRIFAQSTHENDDPVSPPRTSTPPVQDARLEDEFLGIELDGWDNDEENQGEELDEEEEETGADEEEYRRSRRRGMFLNRAADIATRSRGGRNRILDWAEILMVLEDNSLSLPERFVGSREDYLDSVGFETFLQNLADSDGSAKRGAPPASKSAVKELKVVEVASEEQGTVCAICKDGVGVGEERTEMPCGHGYHWDCIATWLGTRNSCPVCRYEMPTDDADYEKRKRGWTTVGSSGSGSSSP